jgi:hypothetical protein
MCNICKKHLTEEEIIKHADKEFCEKCITEAFQSTTQTLNLNMIQDVYADCNEFYS